MEKADPTRLNDVVMVALACVRRSTRKAYVNAGTFEEQEAKRAMARAVTEAVSTYLDHLERPIPGNSTPPNY